MTDKLGVLESDIVAGTNSGTEDVFRAGSGLGISRGPDLVSFQGSEPDLDRDSGRTSNGVTLYPKSKQKDFNITNGVITLVFDGETGQLKRFHDCSSRSKTGVEAGSEYGPLEVEVNQGWYYYPTFKGESSTGHGSSLPAESAVCSGSTQVTSGSAGVTAALLHPELPTRLLSEGSGSSGDQEGGAYILRPEHPDMQPLPVGTEEGHGDREGGMGGDGEGLVLKNWRVTEGSLVSEVVQVSLLFCENWDERAYNRL
ncbi:unnamed protein product [Choristocarpus tenellus]